MTKSKPLPSLDELQELFDYDPETGELRWKKVLSPNHVSAGLLAGSAYAGRKRVKIRGTSFHVYRIAWMLSYGEDPGESMIDHVNGNAMDDRLINLRLADPSGNRVNQKIRCDNKSGFKGVSWYSRDSKWRAKIASKGKHYHLGYFKTAEEAHAAYVVAAEILHGEFVRYA